MMFIQTILFITFVSTHINAASSRFQGLPEAELLVSIRAVDIKQTEQNALLTEINLKIKKTYDRADLKTYIEEKLDFASECDYPRVISRLAPQSLDLNTVPSQNIYKSLLNKAAERGCVESLTILADICANDKLFENIRDEIAFNKLSSWEKMRTNKALSGSLTTLAALNVCRIIIYDGFDAYQILFQTSGIIGVGACLFPVNFVLRPTDTSAYNTDNLMEAYRIALENHQDKIANSLAAIIRQKNPNAYVTQINTDLL